jgi:hypothetical protein
LPESGGFSGHNDVGQHSEFAPSTQRVPIDCGDYRFWTPGDRGPKLGKVSLGDIHCGGSQVLVQVRASTESPIVTSDNDAVRRFVVGEIAKTLGKFDAGCEIERVPHLRPIDPNQGDTRIGAFASYH